MHAPTYLAAIGALLAISCQQFPPQEPIRKATNFQVDDPTLVAATQCALDQLQPNIPHRLTINQAGGETQWHVAVAGREYVAEDGTRLCEDASAITDWTRKHIRVCNDAGWEKRAKAKMTHELGHVAGLPHSEDGPMRYESNQDVDYTSEDHEIVRGYYSPAEFTP